jgi:GT2 family glycosyltransferase
VISLSIVIVNYKTPQLLADCLQSVYRETSGIGYEVIVVDNNSGDNSKELVTVRFPAVRWIQMDYNAGFARANNEGIRQSKGRSVLLLNSDTLVENNAIGECCLQFEQSAYVACGVQLLNADRTPQISGNYVMKGALNNLLPLPYLGNFFKWLGYSLKVKKTNVPDSQSETVVDWINGAYLMVKKTAIDQVGLMDEDFFLYAEEAEWCGRLKKTGPLCIYGQFKVIHLQGESANEAFGSSGKGYYNLYDRKGLQIMLSNFVRIRKQFGVGWFLFHLVMYAGAVPVFFLGHFLESVFSLRNPLTGYRAGYKLAGNVARLWRYAPVVIKNRPHFYKIL